MDFESILFYALAALAVIPGVMILVTGEVIRVAFWLLASLCGVAGLYLFLGADFLGLTQVLVYIGGIMVLILFGIMMTNRDPGVARAEDANRRSIFGGLAISLILFLLLFLSITTTQWPDHSQTKSVQPTVAGLGRALLTDYVLPFEIISILLLVVLCGAAYLARRRGDEEASHA